MSTTESRVCLSSNPACSGLRPCQDCHNVILTMVLPRAMVSGGFNGSREQAEAFFKGYGQAYAEVLTRFQPAPPEPPPLPEPAQPAMLAAPVLSQKEEPAGPLNDDELLKLMGEAMTPPTDSSSTEPEETSAEGETPEATSNVGAIARRARALRNRIKSRTEK